MAGVTAFVILSAQNPAILNYFLIGSDFLEFNTACEVDENLTARCCTVIVPCFLFSFRTLHRTTLLPPSSSSTVVQKETGYKPNVSLDSLIQGLIYERQTGNYFQMYLQTTGNKVFLCWC